MRRNSRNFLSLNFLFIYAIFFLTTSLHAEVIQMGRQEIIQRSKLIFVGEVLEKQARWNDKGNLIVTDYVFQINEILFGDHQEKTITLTFAGGEIGNEGHRVYDVPEFTKGKNILLMIEDSEIPLFSPVTGMYQGKFSAVDAYQNGKPIVYDGTQQVLKGDRGIMIYFEDFINMVKQEIPVAKSKPLPDRLIPDNLKQYILKDLPCQKYDPNSSNDQTISTKKPASNPNLNYSPSQQSPPHGSSEILNDITTSPISNRIMHSFSHLANSIPIVFNQLPTTDPISPHDQFQMSYWNMYCDIFRVLVNPTGTWAWGNGRYDIAGFVDNATMIQQFGEGWGANVLAICYLRWYVDSGLSIEADIALNPAFNWTLDGFSTYRNPLLHNVDQTLLHEIGHSWGAEHEFNTLSVMNYAPHKYRAYTVLFLDDAMGIRSAYPNHAMNITDLNIALYYSSGFQDNDDADLSTQLLAPGENFTVSNFIIENTGTTIESPTILWFLVPNINSWIGAMYIGATNYNALPQDQFIQPSSIITLPSTIPAGKYYLGAFIALTDDDAPNNNSWLDRLITVNTPPVAISLTIIPADPKTTDDLFGSYIYNDADGDPQGATQIRWYKNGILQSTYNNNLTIPFSATTKGEQWYFTVRPHDGKEYGSMVTSPTVLIHNTPPVVSELVITPVKPLDEDDLVISYTYADDDGDVETGSEIHWYKNGIHQPAYDNFRSLPASATTPTKYWHFSVRPNDGEDFGTIAISAPVPIDMRVIIEAENMQGRKSWYGNPCEDGWRLTHPDQPIFDTFEFPADFLYRLTVIAKGEMAYNEESWLKAQVGAGFTGACEIAATEWANYTFVASVDSGSQPLILTFLNDWWNLDSGDRNLLIDKIILSCQFDPLPRTSFTFEAETMSQQNHTQLDPTGNYAILPKYYSYVAHNMFFEQPKLDFEIIAKADSAKNGWPEIELWIDNEVRSLPVDKLNPASYFFTVTGFATGPHCVKIDGKNDSWASGRQLYIDKLIIHTTDGSLLKRDVNAPLSDRTPAPAIPDRFALQQNYPNPFNPETLIDYQIPDAAFVMIKIFNVLGKEIRTLVNESKPAGSYTIKWDGADNRGNSVVSGIYLYQLQAGSFTCWKKMVLTK